MSISGAMLECRRRVLSAAVCAGGMPFMSVAGRPRIRVIVACAALALSGGSVRAALYATFPLAGDEDSGISTNKVYTHKVDLCGGGVTINGVALDATGTVGAGTVTGPNYTLEIPGLTEYTGATAPGVSGAAVALLSTFYYNSAATPEILTLSGLEENTAYKAVFYNRAWGGLGGRIQAITDSQGGRIMFDQNWNSDGNGTMLIATYTTGPGETAVSFTNTPSGAGSFHQYGFTNERLPAPETIEYSAQAINGDAGTGIGPGRIYTHLVNFAEDRPAGVNINGVHFAIESSGLTGPGYALLLGASASAGRWSGLGGGSGVGILISNFHYNGGFRGDPEYLTLTGLSPSTKYRITCYNQGWGDPGTRWVHIACSAGGVVRFDQNFTGDTNATMASLTYTTAASGAGSTSVVFSILQESGGSSFHQYGFTNERVDSEPTSIVLNGRFDSPAIGAGSFAENSPADHWASLTAGGFYGGGIVADGCAYGNPPAPDGDGQAGLIKGTDCGMYQTLSLDTNKTYRLGFCAGGRGDYGGEFSVTYAGTPVLFGGRELLDPGAGHTQLAYVRYLSDPFKPAAAAGELAFVNRGLNGFADSDVCNYIDDVQIEEYTRVAPALSYESWQTAYFGSAFDPDAAPGADPLGKGISNTNQFLIGLDPTNLASVLEITRMERSGGDLLLSWKTTGGNPYSPGPKTNLVELLGDAAGGYAPEPVGPGITNVIGTAGDATATATDVGGALGPAGRYYRVRVLPR